MISLLKAKGFAAVPHLETCQLMQGHPLGVQFSLVKPNVVVGPNGSGKTALLTALSMLTLTHFSPESVFEGRYLTGPKSDAMWKDGTWNSPCQFLPGLDVETDHGAALFYRPSHIPGNEATIAASMMTGYFEQAKSFGEMTRGKSSGQQAGALLERAMNLLDGSGQPVAYRYSNWRFGTMARTDSPVPRSGQDRYASRADVLLNRIDRKSVV